MQDFVLTDSEQAVQDLVAWLERSLWHGLKRFTSDDEPITLWSVVSRHLVPLPEDTETIDQVLRLGTNISPA